MGSEFSLDQVVAAFDELDRDERPRFAVQEDRKWMWAHRKPGRAEYHEQFNGPAEIVEWMATGVGAERGGYIPEARRAELIQESWQFDKRVFDALREGIQEADYLRYIGSWNADDFAWATCYPVPPRQRVRTVLDFGAGYGRQLNLWSQHVSDLRYIAVDVIRKPYLAQAAYFQFFDLPFQEYVIDPSGFVIGADAGIYHVPAWRWDLVPDNSIDLILAVMVLPEVHSETLYRVLDQFKRVMKPSGALFIRDHGLVVKSANTEDVASALIKRSFAIEFRPHAIDDVEIRGVPRVWRKRDPSVPIIDERPRRIDDPQSSGGDSCGSSRRSAFCSPL